MDIQKGRLNVPDSGEYKVIYPETSFDQVLNSTFDKNLEETLVDIKKDVSKITVLANDFLVGDGVTDDSNALNALIEELGSNGGGVIKFSGVFLFNSNIYIKYSNIKLQGDGVDSTVFNLSDGVKIEFWKDKEEVIPTTNPLFTEWNNLPPFNDLLYFKESEFGGIENRLKNVGVSNIQLNKAGDSPYALSFHKCDSIYFNDVDIVFSNPSLIPVSGIDNAVKFYYCSDIKNFNIKIADNFKQYFGIFYYWSFGIVAENIKIGSVVSKGLELKHVVNFSGKNISVENNYLTTEAQNVVGLSVGYGSHLVTLENLYFKNCSLRLANSTEFEYSTDISVNNVVFEDVHVGLDIWSLKGFSINNVRFVLKNRFANVTPVLHVIQPITKFVDIAANDSLYTKNSAVFNYDHDYDIKENLTYGGVNHFRYYEYKHQPSLVNGSISNVSVEFKESNNVASCNLRMFSVTGFLGINYSEFVRDGRLKVSNNHLPVSWESVDISNININIAGDGIATTKVFNTFFAAPILSLKNCNIRRVNYNVENASSVNISDNVPDIQDLVFLNVSKLTNVGVEDVRTLPYAGYGNSLSIIRAFDNFYMKNFQTKITNLDGSYNPTFLKFIDTWLGSTNAATDLSNEDYKNITLENLDVKGFRTLLAINKARANITDQQLKTPKMINNNIENSGYTESNYRLVTDNTANAINQTVLKSLNTVNGILIP